MELQILSPLRRLALLGVCLVTLAACNRETTLDIDIPVPPDEYFVECYIEPDSIIRLSVTRPLPLLRTPDPEEVVVPNAIVMVRQGNQSFALTYNPPGTPGNVYPSGEYRSAVPAPAAYGEEFTLELQIPDGPRMTARTVLPPAVPIDLIREIIIRREGRDYRSLPVEWLDPNTAVENFFYYSTQPRRNPTDSTVSYSTSDIRNGGLARDETGGPPWYLQGDTVTVRFAHVTKDFYQFYESIGRAINGNGNPFTEPGTLRSNITGGIGIFTAFYVDKREHIVR